MIIKFKITAIPKLRIPDSQKLGANYNKYNNTKENDNKSNLILSDDEDGLDGASAPKAPDMTSYDELVRDNLNLDILLDRNPCDRDSLMEIYELILETVKSPAKAIRIGKTDYPAEVVKSRFLKLNSAHIGYVMDCLRSNTSEVHNIKQYLLTVLYNAPVTMSNYYQAKVNRDWAG